MKKNMLFVMINLYNGGAERSLINLLKLLDYNKYNVDLLLFKKEGTFLKEVPSEVSIIELDETSRILYGNNEKKSLINIYFYIYRAFATIISRLFSIKYNKQKRIFRWKNFYSKKIKKLTKKYDTAIAYMHGEPTYFVSEKVDSTNKVCWIHTDYSAYIYNGKYTTYEASLYNNYTHIITVSNICAQSFKNIIKDKRLFNKIRVLPNLTSKNEIIKKSEEFYPIEYVDKKELFILSIGRLTRLKRFDRAIEASKILKEKGILFKWFIIGDGGEDKKLRRLIKENNVSDVCFLLGTRNNPYPYIKNSDIVVQTSEYEGKSMVLDEAKILGKFIISTSYKSVFDQIKNEETGIIVNKSSEAVSDGIIKLISNKKIYQKIKTEIEKGKWTNEDEIYKYYNIFDN